MFDVLPDAYNNVMQLSCLNINQIINRLCNSDIDFCHFIFSVKPGYFGPWGEATRRVIDAIFN